MTCSRTVTAVTGPSQIPVSITSTAQGYVYIGCCDGYIPITPTQYVAWVPIDEDVKAALLDPWDGESFIGPADVARVVITSGGGGGGGGTATPGETFTAPSGFTDDGGGGINDQ